VCDVLLIDAVHYDDRMHFFSRQVFDIGEIFFLVIVNKTHLPVEMMTTTKPRKNDPKQAARLQALEEFNDGLKANSLNAKRGVRAIEAEDRQRAARSALIDSKRKEPEKPTKATPKKATPKKVIAPDEFNDGLKANSLNAKRGVRAIEAEDRQRAARSALVDSKRKEPEKPTKPARVIVEEEIAAIQDAAGLDLSDLTYEQIEALKEYGGLTGNMSRKQVDEIISRVSPLTEDGTPFVVTTPGPKRRFLPPRRLKIKDIVTGKEIML
jgi:hypothetical protein